MVPGIRQLLAELNAEVTPDVHTSSEQAAALGPCFRASLLYWKRRCSTSVQLNHMPAKLHAVYSTLC